MKLTFRLGVQKILFILLFGFVSSSTIAQFGDPGVMLTFGIGAGYSSHADSYELNEQFRIREYPGFRAYIIESKLGWNFGGRTLIYVTGSVSPANTTLSPYRSYYAGIGASQSLSIGSSFYLVGGVGFNKGGIEAGRNVGTGVLTTLGMGFKLSNKIYLELSTLFGKMDEENYLDPNPFTAREFKFQAIFSYSFL